MNTSIRTPAICIAKWSNDLLMDATIYAERELLPEASVYRDGAMFKIASIRRELDDLEAALAPAQKAVA